MERGRRVLTWLQGVQEANTAPAIGLGDTDHGKTIHPSCGDEIEHPGLVVVLETRRHLLAPTGGGPARSAERRTLPVDDWDLLAALGGDNCRGDSTGVHAGDA